jgi:uncharacterized protein (TIGR01777 family)
MEIAITGATGFIGKGLVHSLLENGHKVTVLSRNVGRAISEFGDNIRVLRWDADKISDLASGLIGIDAIVNLAGENIGSSLWTKGKRARILSSRLSAGKLVTDVIGYMSRKPALLIQASAVGYYGTRGEEILDETSAAGTGFLPDVVQRWENSTKAVESMGVRRIIIRTGVVFSSEGGALPKLAMPYRFLVGIVLGSGKQWLPWIHYSDEIEAINFLITNHFSSGVYNLVSPNSARMEDVCKTLSDALRRPTIMKVPASLLKLTMGKMAEETILPSQRIVPSRLASAGFVFRNADLKSSISQMYAPAKST